MFNLGVTCPKNYGQCGASIVYDPNKLFVLMPFDEEESPQTLFDEILERLPSWTVLRADKDFRKPEIWCKICANIQEARAIIADLSGPNPNVFLELGLAWGFGRPFILLAQDFEKLPFDTKSFHVIKYERDSSNPAQVANPDKLKENILETLNDIPELPPLTRQPLQTPEGYLNQRIARARSRVVRKFWKLIEEEWRIRGIEDGGHKIVLALLKAYPNTRSQNELVEETGLSQSAVSLILRGKRGNLGEYFTESENQWTFSVKGIYWMLDEGVPEILSKYS